jgi:ribosomal protein S18 acetylase RimI-like enzyme
MSDTPLFLRPARIEDSASIVSLIRLSMGEEVAWLFGQEKDHPTDSVLAKLFKRKRNRVSRDVCWVTEQEGKVAGLLLAFPGRLLRWLELKTGVHLVSILGLPATIRLARRQPVYGDLLEAEADEFYISNLAVSPELQGKGIGSKILSFADQLARRAGLSKCSLIVTFDNPARHLYERCGYQVVHAFPIDHPVIAHGSGGFNRMVKTFETKLGT